MSLDYSVPKRVPKWVIGFVGHLEHVARVADANVPQMALTWKQYETTNWADFQARGKKRGEKKPKGDKPEKDDNQREKDDKQKQLRQKLKELRRIADNMASNEMAQIVADMEALV